MCFLKSQNLELIPPKINPYISEILNDADDDFKS